MYLAKIQLQGFKSFAKPTNVEFDTGITAIVGPNGCGKSNIVDALRWVLGEQKPSSLRSASMSNVIFNGTSTKKPLGMAEVSLLIQNNKGILPSEFNDITITRRLFRSGESEYLLNNTPCRLKDILELFMDTGMGSGAYSVIELKMVEEILNDKQNDRRKLFEEAAGVTKYKERRKQTLRKLDETRGHLMRLEDILVVIRKNVRSLQLQAGKAVKQKEYVESLRTLELQSARSTYEQFLRELEPLTDKMISVEKEKDSLEREDQQFQEVMTIAKEQLQFEEQALKQAQMEYEQTRTSLQEVTTELTVAYEKVRSEEKSIQQYQTTVYEAERTIKELQESIEFTTKDIDLIRAQVDKSKLEVDESEQKVLTMEEEFKEYDEAVQQLQKSHKEANLILAQSENAKVRYDTRLENVTNDILRAQQQQTQIDEEVTQERITLNQITEQVYELNHLLEKKEQRVESLKQEKESLQQLEQEQKDAKRGTQSKIDSVNAEISLLKTIAASQETIPASVVALLKTFGEDRFQTLGELFSIKEEYAVALESALGSLINLMVCKSVFDIEEATAYLKEHQLGMASFIALEQVPESKNPDSQSMASLVQCEEKYRGLCNWILGKVMLVQSVIKPSLQLVSEEDHIFVNVEGALRTSRIVYKDGSVSKDQGLRVGFKDRLYGLEKRVFLLEDQLDEIERELIRTGQVLEQLPLREEQKAYTEIQRQRSLLETKHSAVATKLELKEQTLATLNQRLETLLEQRSVLEVEGKTLAPEIEAQKRRLDAFTENEVRQKNKRDEAFDALSRIKNRYNQLRLVYQQNEHKVLNLEKDRARDRKEIDSLKQRLDSQGAQARQSKENLDTINDRIAHLKEQQESFSDLLEERKRKVGEIDTVCAKIRGKINQIEKSKEALIRKKEVNRELAHQLEISKSKLEMKLTGIADHIWDEYALLIKDIDHPLPSDVTIQQAQTTISELKQKIKNLGQVNELAIDEYEEEKEKLDLYETQMNDLFEAEKQLTTTINEINATAQERFLTTFEAIRANFKEVFHTLFEHNDQCDLKLIKDEEDPLNSAIEIFAQPRGKRPSHINQLSGGEKTLTAIALLFAIYLVKPSPFCILDEVDAPLDDANIERFSKILRRFSKETQFIVITHNKKTMEKAERMYGVTMQETGVSSVVGVNFGDANVA